MAPEEKVGLFEQLASLCRCGTIILINVNLLDDHSAINAQTFFFCGGRMLVLEDQFCVVCRLVEHLVLLNLCTLSLLAVKEPRGSS